MRLNISIIILLLCGSIYAQQNNAALDTKWSYGLHAGFTINYFNTHVSELGNNDDLGYESSFRLSAQLGIGLQYKINDLFRIKSGLRYNGRGMQYRKRNEDIIITGSNGTENGYQKTRFRLDYLEVPMQFSVNLSQLSESEKDHSFPLFANIGFVPGFNILSDIRYNSYNPSGSSGSQFQEVRESFSKESFDYATPFIMNASIGFMVLVRDDNDAKIWLDVEYLQSLNNVYNSSEIPSNENYDTRIGTISFGLLFEFF
jgi:hypothetical protein